MKTRLVQQAAPLVAAIVLSLPAYSQAVTIATCSDLKGFANYHHTNFVPKKDSGFQDDKVSSELTTLQRLANGEYDVLIVDARRQPISMRNDGANILLLRKGTNDATFFVAFPGMVNHRLSNRAAAWTAGGPRPRWKLGG